MPRPADRPNLGHLNIANDIWHSIFRNYYNRHADVPNQRIPIEDQGVTLQDLYGQNPQLPTDPSAPNPVQLYDGTPPISAGDLANPPSMVRPHDTGGDQIDYGTESSPPPGDTTPGPSGTQQTPNVRVPRVDQGIQYSDWNPVPTGIFPQFGGGFSAIPGETMLQGGGTAIGQDAGGRPVYQPLGTGSFGAMSGGTIPSAGGFYSYNSATGGMDFHSSYGGPDQILGPVSLMGQDKNR